MASITYFVVLRPNQNGGYEAVCPALDCTFEGADVHAAIDGIKTQIDAALAEMRAAGREPPVDDGFRIALEYEEQLRDQADHNEPLSLATHEVEVSQ